MIKSSRSRKQEVKRRNSCRNVSCEEAALLRATTSKSEVGFWSMDVENGGLGWDLFALCEGESIHMHARGRHISLKNTTVDLVSL